MKLLRTALVVSGLMLAPAAWATGTLECEATTDNGAPVRVMTNYSYTSGTIVSGVRISVGFPGQLSYVRTLPLGNVGGQFVDAGLLLLSAFSDDFTSELVLIKDGSDLRPEARRMKVLVAQSSVDTALFLCDL